MTSMEMDYARIYTEIKCIGQGNYGSAHLVRSLENKTLYIAKKIPLRSLNPKETEASFTEVNLLKTLNNPHIVSYKNSYRGTNTLIIVMEYCESNLI